MRSVWELIKRGAVLIGLLFFASGCGAKYHLDRAIKKDPKILDSISVKMDTIVITEKKVFKDTFLLKEIDTLTLVRNSVRIDLRRLYDTIEVDVQCPSDTIRVTKEVKVPQIIYQEKKIDSKYLYGLIILIILYTFALLRYTK